MTSRYTMLTAAALLAAATAPAFGAGASDRTLRVGVAYAPPELASTEYRVFTEEGFELDFGSALAKALGMAVEFVEIDFEDQRAALDAGRVDAVIGRGAPAGGQVVDTGFASGSSVAMRSDTNVRTWGNLAGKTLCASEANATAREIAARYDAKLEIVRAPALSLMKVRTGECDAALHDAALLDALFELEDWRKFSATLPPIEPTALTVEVAAADLAADIATAAADLAAPDAWLARRDRWVRNVVFEVYLEQDAPDCH